MKVVKLLGETPEIEVCPCCGREYPKQVRSTDIEYSYAGKMLKVSYSEPYIYCDHCELEFTGEEAADLQHDAVCRVLGRLTKPQIDEVINEFGGTRAELCDLTGIGEASLRRWTRRASIQDVSNDRLLRLASSSAGVEELRRAKRQSELDTQLGDLGIVLRANWRESDKRLAEAESMRFAL